jgi:hypothetical protein
VKGTKNLDAAYRFLGFILEPANSVKDVAFHGCHTGLKDLGAHLPTDLEHREMIVLPPEVLARLQPGALNSAHDRLAQIHAGMKAKVSR